MADETTYLEERQAELRVLDEELRDLAARATTLNDMDRAALDREILALRQDRNAAGRDLERLSAAGDDQARCVFESSWARLRQRLDRIATPND